MVAASELEKDKNLYRRELEWVRRMPKARSTKSKSRVDAFDDLESKVRSVTAKREVNIKMRMERMGAKILEMHHLFKSYGDLKLVEDFSYVFKRGEKVGIVGKNGAGKSTFLNMIMGLEKPDAGKIVHGDTMIFGYYSQQGMRLEEGKKVIDVVRDVADYILMEGGLKLTASQLLLQFGFHYDKQWDFVVKLSGGERRRLYLLTILMKAPNFLILDEPTNDLDIETLGVLEDFLVGYGGCLLIVSHDRYFMDKVVDHCFIFEGEGYIRDFPGNYSDYREWQELEDVRKEQLGTESKRELMDERLNDNCESTASVITENLSNTNKTSSSIVKRKLSFKEKFEFEQLEKEIADLEREKNTLTEELQFLVSDYERISAIGDRMQVIGELLDEKGLRWLELAELME
jgi:ATP-binding cassette subfamily F protein uup